MSDGSFGTGPDQSDPSPDAGWQPRPQYPQPGTYGHPLSPQFRQDYAPPVPVTLPRRTNGLAIASLCCGVGQIVAGPLAAIPAIILGAMSLKEIRETGEDGHGMAVAGLVLGIVGTLLVVLAIALFAAFASIVFHQVNHFPPPPVPKGFPPSN